MIGLPALRRNICFAIVVAAGLGALPHAMAPALAQDAAVALRVSPRLSLEGGDEPAPLERKSSRSRKSSDEAKRKEGDERKSSERKSDSKASKERTVSLSFRDMGAWSDVNLRGVDGSRTLNFSVRGDEVVVAARLKFGYEYSPALIPELSHLRVLLNERTAWLGGLPKDKYLGNEREINLDPRLFKSQNYLRLNLIGHYTRQCEDPFHSSLWLTLSNQGSLELTLAPVARSNDLKYLPAPFFDGQDNDALRLPFVFVGSPNLARYKAAGVVASWFGIQAGTRGAQFPVLLNTLPAGNAVVFMRSGESFGDLSAGSGASISVQTHPRNPNAKLLLITGSTDEEFARAARALALVSTTLTGQTARITGETPAQARKAYDAPAWIPTDRPVKLGELANAAQMRVQGYYPEVIRLNYRLPPDVFTWRTLGAPLLLKYRATRLPLHHNSSLNLGLNGNFIQALALNTPDSVVPSAVAPLVAAVKKDPAVHEEALFVPPYASAGRDQLQMSYYFDVIKQGECAALPPDNLQGAIDPESVIDFSGFPRYVAMPNLAYFASLGYPFTRMADLSETAVVLPSRPTLDVLSTYLTSMGRMGEATGFPVLSHEVVLSKDVSRVADRDLIVIGSGSNQSLMIDWAEHMPLVNQNNERRLRAAHASWLPTYRWEQVDVQSSPSPRATLTVASAGNLTAMMGFQSPLKSGRSVVWLFADKSADLQKINALLQDPERSPSVQGDFVVVDDKAIEHARVSETYYLGHLPTWSKLRWFFAAQPWLLALLGLVMCIVLATLLYRRLRGVAAARSAKKQA